MKLNPPEKWQLTNKQAWWRMILGSAFEPIKQLQGNNNERFEADKITYTNNRKAVTIMKQTNKYEQDRLEILRTTEWYAYFANPKLVTNTLEANDRLIVKEGVRLRETATGNS